MASCQARLASGLLGQIPSKKKPVSLQAFLYLAPRPGLEPGTQ